MRSNPPNRAQVDWSEYVGHHIPDDEFPPTCGRRGSGFAGHPCLTVLRWDGEGYYCPTCDGDPPAVNVTSDPAGAVHVNVLAPGAVVDAAGADKPPDLDSPILSRLVRDRPFCPSHGPLDDDDITPMPEEDVCRRCGRPIQWPD